jgi:hypothetical protein
MRFLVAVILLILLNDILWISKPDTIVYHTQPTFEGFMDWLEKKMENK